MQSLVLKVQSMYNFVNHYLLLLMCEINQEGSPVIFNILYVLFELLQASDKV